MLQSFYTVPNSDGETMYFIASGQAAAEEAARELAGHWGLRLTGPASEVPFERIEEVALAEDADALILARAVASYLGEGMYLFSRGRAP